MSQQKCAATLSTWKNKGHPCSNKAKLGTTFCGIHNKEAVPKQVLKVPKHKPSEKIVVADSDHSSGDDEEGMSEELALAIAEAVHPDWDDEQTDTYENIDGIVFANFDAIIDCIMTLDEDRKNAGWGAGKLVKDEVIIAVKKTLPQDFVYNV